LVFQEYLILKISLLQTKCHCRVDLCALDLTGGFCFYLVCLIQYYPKTCVFLQIHLVVKFSSKVQIAFFSFCCQKSKPLD